MAVGSATWCSSEKRAWGPRDLLRDLGEQQLPEMTCHNQDVGREKGWTHLVTRKALAG